MVHFGQTASTSTCRPFASLENLSRRKTFSVLPFAISISCFLNSFVLVSFPKPITIVLIPNFCSNEKQEHYSVSLRKRENPRRHLPNSFEGSLLSGDRYYRGISTTGRSLLLGDGHFRGIATFGDSLLKIAFDVGERNPNLGCVWWTWDPCAFTCVKNLDLFGVCWSLYQMCAILNNYTMRAL